VQNSAFFHTPLVFLSSLEFEITKYYDPARLCQAGNQDTNLCRYPLLLHHV